MMLRILCVLMSLSFLIGISCCGAGLKTRLTQLANTIAAAVFAVSLVTMMFAMACGSTFQQHTPTAIRATLGSFYGACQTVDSNDATWRRICDGVERSLPHLGQLGAGPAELPPDVAAREVTITIDGAQ